MLRRLYDWGSSPNKLPRLTIAQRVIDKMVANALIYDTETGESLVGLAVPVENRPEPDLYVIETIAPDASAIRGVAYFEQGDDLQGDIFNWYSDNWNQFRAQRRTLYGTAVGAKWDLPLAVLGDWHKHPGHYIEPSGGDYNTAIEHINDTQSGIPQLLVILATVWTHNPTERLDKTAAEEDEEPSDLNDKSIRPHPLWVKVNDSTTVRLDFWYLSQHLTQFTRLAATVVNNNAVPDLPAIGWHLTNYARLEEEISDLKQIGFSTTVRTYDINQVPPLEVCLLLFKVSAKHIFVVVTEADFPRTRPVVRYAPISVTKDIPEDADSVAIFTLIWERAQPVPASAYPDHGWTVNSSIRDLIVAIQHNLEAVPNQHEQKQ